MSLHLLDLRPIKDIPVADKALWPVSITSQPDGTPLVVSRFGDYIWDFYPYIPQENHSSSQKQIDWRITLPDGRLLTDPAHFDLLESTKDFIWSLFADPVEGRKRPAMLTLRNKVGQIKPLLRWMVSQGMSRFADVGARAFDYVRAAKLNEDGLPVAVETVTIRLGIVEDIYRQRNKLRDALSAHPWPHESACSLSGQKSRGGNLKPKTEFIPDEVAYRLSDAALNYVHSRSAEILDAVDVPPTTSDPGRGAHADVAGDSIKLRTACYIVIDMFSGIRDSEVMSLAENCIRSGISKDGSTNVLWLQGTIYKTGMRPKRWLVPPVVEDAVKVLTRLTAPLRNALRLEEADLEARVKLSIGKERARIVKRLDVVRKHKDKLFLDDGTNARGSAISVLSGLRMNKYLKQFCAAHGIRGKNGQPYLLHAHQFRRTYARFMARSELGDLLTLRDHFGHWSIDMTTYYSDGATDEFEADVELLEMVAKEKLGRQSEIMTGYLDSDAPLANGNHWLQDWRASVRTAANKEELIREYADTITLNGTGHSWCVGNAKGTGCGGLCVFEAQMCVDCNYGIIGQEHRPVWEGIRDQQREALALDDMGPGGRARAQQIHDYAEKVLRRLEGQAAA